MKYSAYKAPLLSAGADKNNSDDNLQQQVQTLTEELKHELYCQITQLSEGSTHACSCRFKSSNIEKAKVLEKQLNFLHMSVYGPCDYENGADNEVLLNLCILAKENNDFCKILANIINRAKGVKYHLVKNAISNSEKITGKNKIKDYLITQKHDDRRCREKLIQWEYLLNIHNRRSTYTSQAAPVVVQPDEAPVLSGKQVATGDKKGDDAGKPRNLPNILLMALPYRAPMAAPADVDVDVDKTPTAPPVDHTTIAGNAENVNEDSRPLSEGGQAALNAVAAQESGGKINLSELGSQEILYTKTTFGWGISGKKSAKKQSSDAPGQSFSAVAATGANIRTKLQTNDKTDANRCQNANSIAQAMNTDGLGEYRRARGDGNCFYHATIFLWLSELCEKDQDELVRVKELLLETVKDGMHPNLTSINPRTVKTLPEKDIQDETNKAKMILAINAVFESLDDNKSKDTVVSFMSHQKNMDHCLALVQIARQMTINTLRRYPELYRPSGDDANAERITLDEYITRTASVMGKSAETYMIPAWSKAIGHNIIPVTANIFESQAHQEAKDFIEENAYNNPLVIILSGGHYDILLPTPEKLTRLKNEAVLDNIMKQLENSYMTLDQPRYIQQNIYTLQNDITTILEESLERDSETSLERDSEASHIIQEIVTTHVLVEKPQGIIEEAENIIREMKVFDEIINQTQFEAASKTAVELLYDPEDSENLNTMTAEMMQKLSKECFMLFTLNRANSIYELADPASEAGSQQQTLLEKTAMAYFDANSAEDDFTINKETADAALASNIEELDYKLKKKNLSFNVIFDIIEEPLKTEEAPQHKQILQSSLSSEEEYKLFQTTNSGNQKQMTPDRKKEYDALCNQKTYNAEAWLEKLEKHENSITKELIRHIRDKFTLTVAKPDLLAGGGNGHELIPADEGVTAGFWHTKQNNDDQECMQKSETNIYEGYGSDFSN